MKNEMSYVDSMELSDIEARVMFLYNSKTHQYHIVSDSIAEELIMTKAKAEAVIKFLKWVKQK